MEKKLIWPDDYINNIINMDCLIAMKGIPDKSIDLVLTDPPYGINYQSNMRVCSQRFDILSNDENSFRLSAYSEFLRVLKDNCVSVIFASFKNYAEDYIYLSGLFDIKNVIVWDKGGGGIGDLTHSLLTDYELAIVCHKGKCPIRGKRDGSVWGVGKGSPSAYVHPTQKPVELFSKIISKFSDETALILDPFLGSGTTAVACKELGRRFIGIEISEKYCDLARKRLQYTEKPLF